MDRSRLPEPTRRCLEERDAEPVIDQVRSLLGWLLGEAYSVDEVRGQLQRLAGSNTRGIRRDLTAIEALLANPPGEGVMARLVGWDGNWVLEDPSDAGAAAFLQEVAEMLRQVIAEAPPPAYLRGDAGPPAS